MSKFLYSNLKKLKKKIIFFFNIYKANDNEIIYNILVLGRVEKKY